MRILMQKSLGHGQSRSLSLEDDNRVLSWRGSVARTGSSLIISRERYRSILCPLAISDLSSVAISISIVVVIAVAIAVGRGVGADGDIVDEAKPPSLM